MEKLNSIYAKSYNFVYLRAKTILNKEEDVQQLMKEVYLKAVAEDIDESELYKWLGKQVYILGCGKFRKKKVREADLIELEEKQYAIYQLIDKEKTKEVICEALEELPDMYQATLYACYYDHMTIKEISAVMGYNAGAIINRLNYVHKYLDKALANYKEENRANVMFSVEVVSEALRDWSANHQLSETLAQNIYASICRELGITPESGAVESGIAGANCRVNNAEKDDTSSVCDELKAYSVKKTVDKKRVYVFVIIGVLILLTFVGVMALEKLSKKEDEQENKPAIEKENDVLGLEEDVDEQESEEIVENEENISSEDTNTTDAEYILSKSSTEKLSRADLEGLTKQQLRLARNEIYARHGMIFGVDDLDEYFATKSWYKPTISYSDFYETVEMSLIEEENVILIQQMEKER